MAMIPLSRTQPDRSLLSVRVNTDHIVSVATEDGRTKVEMSSGTIYVVSETEAAVLALIPGVI